MAFIFICPHCGTESNIDDALKGTESECPACCEAVVLEPATERTCPHCGEKIKIMAKVCRFCHQPVASQKDKLINSLKSGLAFVQSKVADGIEMAKKQIDSIRKTDKNTTANAGDPSGVAETEENTKFFWFECPFCHKSIDAEKEWSGMEAECPECGNTIIIPMAPSEKNGNIAEMLKGSDGKKKRKKKIILISVLSVVIIAAACVVFGLTCGDFGKTDDQDWATDEKTQQPPKPVREITVTAVVSLASLRYFNFTDSFCNIKIYAGKELVHQGSRQFSAKTEYEARVTVPYGSILSATIKPDNQSEFKEMNRAKNVYEDLVIGTDMSSSDNYIGGLLGEHPLAAVEDGGKVYIKCGKLYKE